MCVVWSSFLAGVVTVHAWTATLPWFKTRSGHLSLSPRVAMPLISPLMLSVYDRYIYLSPF